MITRAVSMSVIFIYVMPAMVRHFVFFATRKMESMEGELSGFGIFMIIWTFIMWVTKVLHGLAAIILVSVERLDPNVSQGLSALYSFLMRTFTYVVDFLNMITFLYLFYCQALLAESRLKSHKTLEFPNDKINASLNETRV